jgi:hypothetical protein
MKNYNDEVKRLEGVWAVRWATGSFYSKHMTSKASILNQWIRGLLWVGASFAFGLPMHASGLETLFHISTGRPGPKHACKVCNLNLKTWHIASYFKPQCGTHLPTAFSIMICSIEIELVQLWMVCGVGWWFGHHRSVVHTITTFSFELHKQSDLSIIGRLTHLVNLWCRASACHQNQN